MISEVMAFPTLALVAYIEIIEEKFKQILIFIAVSSCYNCHTIISTNNTILLTLDIVL